MKAEKNNKYYKLPIITIDGPGGVGKTTLSVILAQKLNFTLLNSGLLYRSSALSIIDNNINICDIEKIKMLLKHLIVKMYIKNDVIQVYLNSKNITKKICTDNISMMASKIARIREVRNILLYKQFQIASNINNGLIADGRDMGTVVFPNAKFKFFLCANVRIRAFRRYKELINRGYFKKFNNILFELKKRDEYDYNRDISPLKPANDAVIIDTSCLSSYEVCRKMLNIIK